MLSTQAVRGLPRLRALFLALSLSPRNYLVSLWCDHSMLALFTAHEPNSTELTCNKLTQFRDAFIGYARQRRRNLIGCSKTRTAGAQQVRAVYDRDTRCCFNVCSKADMSQLNLPYGISD